MDRISEYLKRGIQMVVGTAIFDVPILLLIRREVYRLMFQMGKRGSILRHVSFNRPHFISGGQLIIGDEVHFNHSIEIDYSGGVTVEDDVWFSQNILIETHEHIYEAGKIKSEWSRRATPLTIRRGAWIGANVTILAQVSEIGANAIVAAGSIVTKNVAPDSIVGGNPARKIKDLAAPETASVAAK